MAPGNHKPTNKPPPSKKKIVEKTTHGRNSKSVNSQAITRYSYGGGDKKIRSIQSVVLSKPGLRSIQSLGLAGTNRSREPTKLLIVKRLHVFSPLKMPLYWDISHLEPNRMTQHIRCLLLALEARPNFSQLRAAYSKIRDNFVCAYGFIQLHSPDPRTMRDKLYNEIIDKLNALLKLADRLESKYKDKLDAASPA